MPHIKLISKEGGRVWHEEDVKYRNLEAKISEIKKRALPEMGATQTIITLKSKAWDIIEGIKKR